MTLSQEDLLECVLDALAPYRCMTDLLSGEDAVASTSIPDVLCIINEVMTSYPENNAKIQKIRSGIWNYMSMIGLYIVELPNW